MRLFSRAPDGGRGSGVTAYFLIEWKALFSIALLRFEKGTREAYHEHAFDAVTLWLKGRVREHLLFNRNGDLVREFKAGQAKLTRRACFHKIEALETSWALTFRGPWADRWREHRGGRYVTLTHGRREIP